MATEMHYIAAQTRPGLAGRTAGPAAADGPGRGDPDLPRPAAVLAGRLRRQGHPGGRRRARRGPAGRPLGRSRPTGRLDTSSVKVFLPGITDTTTLQAASTLCGQASWKLRGQDHATRHDVATPDMIRQLPAGFALVIRGGCAPVITRLPRAWRNPAYRRARRLGQAPAERAAEPRLASARTFPTTCPPSGSPATAPPSRGADHDQQRPDHRPAGPARRAPRAGHPARHHERPNITPPSADSSPNSPTRPPASAAPCRIMRPPSPGSPQPAQADAEPDGYRPGPAPTWWKLAADGRHEPVTRLRAWVEQVYRPGYGHLAASPRPLLGNPRPVPVRPGHPGRALVGAVPAARPQRRAGVRPGRIPGPHPARPDRTAPDRDQPLRPLAQPRTGRRPALEQAMTNATLRQALAFAARGCPVLPCQPGQKTPTTRHGVPRRHHRPGPDHRLVRPPPRLEPGHRHRRSRA